MPFKEGPPIGDILNRRHASKTKRDRGDRWGIYGASLQSYESYFRPVEDMPIDDFIRDRKERNGKVYAFDLMGVGSPFEGLPIDKALACGLKDPELFPVDFVEGDIMSKKTWAAIREWVAANTENQGFDLILCRPVGGRWHIPDDPNISYWLANQMWQITNKHEGHIYTQFSYGINYRERVEEWLEEASASLDLRYDNYAVRFIRHEGDPEDLPKLESYPESNEEAAD